MFLAAIGDDALKVYYTFKYSSAAESKKLTVVVNKFNSYCMPQKKVVFERFQLWKLTQTSGETIDSFVTSLRLRVKLREFGDQ